MEEVNEFLEQYSFTKGQKEFIDMFIHHAERKFEDKRTFVMSGRAGTGKSFVVSILIKVCEMLEFNCITGTFTGKASQVLRDKDVSSDTIHSQIYRPVLDEETGKIIGWDKNEELDADIWFIDEFSMLHEDLINDVLSYGKVTIFTGDEKQLPPVGQDTLYLADRIEHTLDEIVRQARGNPLIKWANFVRDGKFLRAGIKDVNEKGSFITLDKNKDVAIINQLKQKCTQMICGTNKTRHMLNKEYRIKKKYFSILEVGEKLVVLKNDRNAEVFNGQIIEIQKLLKTYVDFAGFNVQKVKTDVGILHICLDTLSDPDIKYDDILFNSGLSKSKKYSKPVFVNYSYALTVFKLQGSQSKSILLFANDLWFMKYRALDNDKGNELYLRSIYTGITRAEKNCIVVI